MQMNAIPVANQDRWSVNPIIGDVEQACLQLGFFCSPGRQA